MKTLRLRILDHGRPVFETSLHALLEVGRQRTDEPEPYSLLPAADEGPARLIVAGAKENNCSRQHLLLEPLVGGPVRVTNRSQIPLSRSNGQPPLAAGTADVLTPPFSLVLETRTIAISASDSVDEHGVEGLDGQTLAPGSLSELTRLLKPLPALSGSQFDELVGWLQTTMGVLQSAVGSADFLARAAEALVQIVGLDSGRVLLLREGGWNAVAAHGVAPDVPAWRPSAHVIERVVEQRKTFWQHPRQTANHDSASLQGLHIVVASPLLDGAGQVIGALYGERRNSPTATSSSDKLEAILVELLACGVSTGLARQEQQRTALKLSIQFEQFFTRELARHLEQDPELLQGRNAKVTLLFCDVRRFSSYSEKLGAAGTVRWIGDVMGELSDRILAEDGVLVDYIGDELLAMWGAPESQTDQAARAVRAALALDSALADLNSRWQATLKEPMDLGIGINTGLAQVGNTGSKHKFKYGPLGNTVNVASRVQGLTKYLRCRLLVTEATRKDLGDGFIARRVCRTKVVNIQEAVELYEVAVAGDAKKDAFFRASEAALDTLQRRDFPGAARQVGLLLEDHPDDGPLLLVLSRAAQMLMQPKAPFDPVWEPPGK